MTYLPPALRPREYTITPAAAVFSTTIDGYTCVFNYHTKNWSAYRDPDGRIGTGATAKDAIQDYLWNLI